MWLGRTARQARRVTRILATFRRLREELRLREPGVEPLATRQYSVVSEALNCDSGEVERIVDEWMYKRPLKWLSYCRRAGLIELLDWLELRGIPRGILSDYPAHEKLAALGVAHRFDPILSATDPAIGAFKPDSRGFAAAARAWNLAPSDILYVGDRLDVDAQGAAAAGMRCAVLTRRAAAGTDVIAIHDFGELKRVLEPLC
jgi:FMN phosphatase YigB (HAD superfamily)